MNQPKISILITTKNRLSELKISFEKNKTIFNDERTTLFVYDDGSTDGTLEFLQSQTISLTILSNEISKGYIYCRNQLLSKVQTPYAISLDDDAHFISTDPISIIMQHFEKETSCGLIAFRIYWGLTLPENTNDTAANEQVKSFVGCGHAWRMKAWHAILPYPEWFEFYGEEDYAAYQLFQKGFQVHYLPNIFVQHRVDLQKRNKDQDSLIRYRRTLRAGWYLIWIFIPQKMILRIFIFSLYKQFQKVHLRGFIPSLKAIILAAFDLIHHAGDIGKENKRLTREDFYQFSKLPETKIFWKPKA